MGVSLPPALSSQLHNVLPSGQGVLVTEVAANSPAAKAGLKTNDVLVGYDDRRTSPSSSSVVAARAPGQEATPARFMGSFKQVAINPGNSGGPLLDDSGRLIGMTTAIISPSGAFAGIGFAIPVDEINEIVPQLIRHGKVVRPRLGVQVAEDQLARKVGVDEGTLVVKVMPDSAAARAGIRGTRHNESGHIVLGDVIMAVNGQAVAHGKDLASVLERYEVGDTVTLTIVRAGEHSDVQVTLQAAE